MKRTRKITIIEEVEVMPSARPPSGRERGPWYFIVRIGLAIAAIFHGGH
ncbi:hypothetical protein I6F33_08010 [Bradyrhizobium sp. BRP20]|nr:MULTISPECIES: hypothetical protein [unclassified Bradyrhizobium]MCA1388700.1 hypothetical protein [Bradyrhizobium sp. IC3123]MCA1432921.1 hypothetical protein [Bradyrhizobium sp. BRP20]MCA1546523.1 hypothetical protein [Bradyrhizobium sp. BRP19]